MSDFVATKAPWMKGAAGPQSGQIRPAELRPGPSIMASPESDENDNVVVTPKGFRTPTHNIKSQMHLDMFLRSPQCAAFQSWLRDVNQTCIGVKLSEAPNGDALSPAVRGMLDVLARMEKWLEEIPPIQQPMRYGNKAYRDWHERVKENAEQMMRDVLPDELKEAAVELGVYLWESIGNATRIDYGTGHELAFVALLFCGAKIGFFAPNDAQALVLRVFNRYIELMRAVQGQYLLEPAGSHGVWSLDDYQFLPFYFGAAQLRDQENYSPASIRDKHLVRDLKSEYMYMAAIDFINNMKTGPFGEHSPLLNDISGVKQWYKVNEGMLKMWRDEVIGKFPVMQHFRFGSIFAWPEADESSTTEVENNNEETKNEEEIVKEE